MLRRSRPLSRPRPRAGGDLGPFAPDVPGLDVGAPLVPVSQRVAGRPVAWWAAGDDGTDLVVQRVRPARRGSSAPLAGLDEASLRRALPHPHVLPLLRVVRTSTGPVQVLGPAPGGTLADLLGRGPLSAGQVVVLVAGLGTALAALHEEGLVHGEVSAGGVVVDGAGMPALVGWGAARPVVVRRAERHHAQRAPAEPAADVRALVQLALTALGDEERSADDGGARVAVRSVLQAAEPALAADELARRCWAVAPARPFAVPGPLLPGAGAPPVAARVRGREVWAARLARRPGRWAVLPLGGALLVAAAAVVLVPPGAAESRGPAAVPAAVPAVAEAPAVDARLTGDDPAAAVAALAQLRADALAAGDPAALDRVDAAGSAALRADLAALAALGGTRREGLEVVVHSAAVVGAAAGSAGQGGVWLDVVSRTSAHRVVGDSGSREVPEGEPVASRVLLERVGGAWRVADTA